ncbi:hypothetical protein [Gracilibacillus salinarum]|uniref:Uncharacterized protein n=1 Tax=Gracilibacillus salinarum TaxID=2932255 RepID=A0ABY4GIT3_9BACI|nr:hypothetical protein [Gracilibacillus salinarum]UOQ84162.1 hypothetical protein MUN87_15805 [Gracilibacillus salinarum]
MEAEVQDLYRLTRKEPKEGIRSPRFVSFSEKEDKRGKRRKKICIV